MVSPTMLLLAAILLGIGFWLIVRTRFLIDAFHQRGLLESPRAASLVAITLLAIGIGAAGLGCRILALRLGW